MPRDQLTVNSMQRCKGVREAVSSSREGKVVRTFTVYEDLCSISVCAHKHRIVVYLSVCQAVLTVDDFQQLCKGTGLSVYQDLATRLARGGGGGQGEGAFCYLRSGGWDKGTHSVGDAVSESHELDFVFGALPIREKRQNESKSGCLRVGGAIREGDVAEGGCDAILRVVGAHVGSERMRGRIGERVKDKRRKKNARKLGRRRV